MAGWFWGCWQEQPVSGPQMRTASAPHCSSQHPQRPARALGSKATVKAGVGGGGPLCLGWEWEAEGRLQRATVPRVTGVCQLLTWHTGG